MNTYVSDEDIQETNKYLKECSASLVIQKCKLKQCWDSIPLQKSWLLSKNQPVTNAGGFVSKKRTLLHCCWTQCNYCGNQFGNFLKKVGWEVPFNPAIPFLDNFPKELKASCHIDICAHMFTVAQFLLAKSWKQLKCLSTHNQIRKVCVFYTVKYYSAVKKNKFETFIGKWVDLETLLWCEINWTNMYKYKVL